MPPVIIVSITPSAMIPNSGNATPMACQVETRVNESVFMIANSSSSAASMNTRRCR